MDLPAKTGVPSHSNRHAKSRDGVYTLLFERHCQVADERAFFSLGAERPSLGQQAHVTSSH